MNLRPSSVSEGSWSVRFVQPMAASLVDALPTGDEWLDEAKFDGYRVLALKDGSTVKLLSRKGTISRPITRRFARRQRLESEGRRH